MSLLSGLDDLGLSCQLIHAFHYATAYDIASLPKQLEVFHD
jgi:hypothetical protein